MRKLMVIAIALLAVASLVLVAGCGTKTGEPKAKKGGVLVFGRSGDAVGLDPARETDGESFYIADNVYETLTEFAPGSTDLVPGSPNRGRHQPTAWSTRSSCARA
jgi:peptide/nickel transport system substrate-binding protein